MLGRVRLKALITVRPRASELTKSPIVAVAIVELGRGVPRHRARTAHLSGGSGVDAGQADVLQLEELVHPVVRALAADPGLLHAAEGRALVREDAGVHG